MGLSAGNKKEYLIGDISRIVGMSRDTLRFYEKKGIIQTKKKENGYRYFSEDDIYRLMSIFYHRKMNDSLEDIDGFLNGETTVGRLQNHLSQRIAEEEAQLYQHKQALTRLKLTKRDITAIENHLGRCCLKPFPSAYIVGNCRDLQEGLRQWFRLSSAISGMDMTYFYNVFSFQNNELVNQGTQLLLYKEVAEEMKEGFSKEAYPMTTSRDCIYMIASSEEPLPQVLFASYMEQWGRDQGLKTESVIYSNNMTCFSEKQIYYLELYMPVVQ